MIFNYYSKIKVVRALCEDIGINIKYTMEDAPRTDGKTLFVPKPSPDWTPAEFLLWEYKVYHEAGHCHPDMRDVFTVMLEKELNMGSFLGYVWNLLDDHRQEYHKHDLYEGKRKVMSQGRGMFLDAQAKAANSGPCSNQQDAIGKALFAWDSYKRTDFQPECIPAALVFIDKMDPESLEYYNKLLESGDRFVTRNMNALQEYETAKELLDYLGLDSSEEEEKSSSDSGESSCESTKYLFHKHSDSDSSEYVKSSAPSSDSTGEYMPTPDINIIRKFCTSRDVFLDLEPSSIGKAVRKLIQVRSQAHYQQGLKRGKLGRNLHRTCIPDSGGYGERVFKQKIESTTKDISIMVLTDCSGSMYGSKYTSSIKACALLNDALSVTGVSYSIVGFSYKSRKPEHFMFKEFASTISTSELVSRMLSCTHMLNDNADGESLLWANGEMLKRKSSKRLIITLSDGAPAAAGTVGLGSFTRRVIKEIEKAGVVELYGIGIEDSTVKRYYKKYEVIDDASQLESALINVIKNKVLS